MGGLQEFVLKMFLCVCVAVLGRVVLAIVSATAPTRVHCIAWVDLDCLSCVFVLLFLVIVIIIIIIIITIIINIIIIILHAGGCRA